MFLLAGSLVCGIFAAIIASNKGRSAVGCFFLGLIFNLIAVLAVGFLSRVDTPAPGN